MNAVTGYIAFSYNYDADRQFVARIADEMQQRGISTWYLPELVKPTNITTQQRLGGDFDWRQEPQNWHAAFAERLYEAKGIIVVLSPTARESYSTVGRGMWRERAAVDFIRQDNLSRVREIENPLANTEQAIPEGLVAELVEWGKMVLNLPPVPRQSIGDPNAFNTPTGETGPLQLPERKSKPTDWYELVRLDLYDVEWHCRRCSLKSYSYIMAHENPPECCPRCGFDGRAAAEEAS